MTAHQAGCCCVVGCEDCTLPVRKFWVVDLGTGGINDGTPGNCCADCTLLNGEHDLHDVFGQCKWIKNQFELCNFDTDDCDGCRPADPFDFIVMRLEIHLTIDEIPDTDPVRCGPYKIEIDLQHFGSITDTCFGGDAGHFFAFYSESGPTSFDQDPDDVTTWLTLTKDSDEISGGTGQGTCGGSLPSTIRIRREVDIGH